jgi:peptidoglycan/LPS O-acetylase OafA/YrhL
MWGSWVRGTDDEQTIGQALAPGTVLSRVRIPELDGIRGLAILTVLGYHLVAYSMQLWSQAYGEQWSAFPKLARLLTWPGFLGVDIFFVLSGFLITGILLDTKDDEHFLRNFYARRALRILPLYLAVLATIACAYSGIGKFLLLSVFFLSNLSLLLGIRWVGPLWSLSVEEHFYLIWPWVVKATSRRTLVKIALLTCAIEPIIRICGFPIWGDGYFYSWTRFDGLAWGALVACFARSRATRSIAFKTMWICMIAAVVVLAAGVPFGLLSRHNLVGTALQYAPAQFFSMTLILAALSIPGHGGTSFLRNKVMRLFGDLSYCLYLIHMLLMDGYDALVSRFALAPELTLGPFGAILLRAAIVLAASVGLALFSRRFIELPGLRLKRYLERKPTSAVTAVSQ